MKTVNTIWEEITEPPLEDAISTILERDYATTMKSNKTGFIDLCFPLCFLIFEHHLTHQIIVLMLEEKVSFSLSRRTVAHHTTTITRKEVEASKGITL
jgi:hypothetical protein